MLIKSTQNDEIKKNTVLHLLTQIYILKLTQLPFTKIISSIRQSANQQPQIHEKLLQIQFCTYYILAFTNDKSVLWRCKFYSLRNSNLNQQIAICHLKTKLDINYVLSKMNYIIHKLHYQILKCMRKMASQILAGFDHHKNTLCDLLNTICVFKTYFRGFVSKMQMLRLVQNTFGKRQN